MAESSVSKSVSATIETKSKQQNFARGTTQFIDKTFPLFEQMMQATKIPSWILSILMFYILNQVCSVGMWVYTPAYSRKSGAWVKFYTGGFKLFTFINPIDHNKSIITWTIVDICIAAFILIWIFFSIFCNTKLYKIPAIMLHISTILIDIIAPILIIPSVFIIDHGITGFSTKFSNEFVIEIIIGSISYIIFISLFMLSTFLHSRSVILTNFLFPLFDHLSVTLWMGTTSFFSIISAIMTYFNAWYFTIVATLHILVLVFICYRLLFIPFYETWRNSLCLGFCLTMIVLDINYYILYALPNLTYIYTIFVLIVGVIVFYIISFVIFTAKINKIKKQLRYQNDITDIKEYLESINFGKNSLTAMMYIIVGLIESSDIFIDGSLTDYALNSENLVDALSILLQIVTFFPFESRKVDVLYKRIVSKRKLGVTDRFLIYQVYRIKMRRLMSDTKDTLELFNKIKCKNEGLKSVIKSFWDNSELNSDFLSTLCLSVNDMDSYFQTCISNNPNNLRLVREYSDFLTECKCDFEKAIKEYVRADHIADGRNFNVDISFRSLVNKFPRYILDEILDVKGHRKLKTGDNKFEATNNSSQSSNSASLDANSIDIEKEETISSKILRDSKLRLALHKSINDTVPIHYNMVVINVILDVVLALFFFIGFYVYVHKNLNWRRSSYQDIADAAYSVFYTIYANVYTISKFAADTGRLDPTFAIIGNTSIDDTFVVPLVPYNLTVPQKTYYCMNQSRYFLKNLLSNLAETAEEGTNVYEIAPVLLYNNMTFYVCDGATPLYNYSQSLSGELVAINYLHNVLAGLYQQGAYYSNIYTSNDYCQVLSNFPELSDFGKSTFLSIFMYNVERSSKYKSIFKAWMIIGSVLMFLSIGVPIVLIDMTYNKQIDEMTKVLHSLSNNIKEECKKELNLTREYDNSNIAGQPQEKRSNYLMQIRLTYYLFLIGLLICYILFCKSNIRLNDNLTMILRWFYYSCIRNTYASQLGNNAITLIFLNGSLSQTIVNTTQLMTLEEQLLDDLTTTENILLYGNSSIRGCIGYDEELDDLTLSNQCDLGRDPSTMHDMYACAGVDSQINTYKMMITQVIKDLPSFQGNMLGELAANMAHLLRYHLYPQVIKSSSRIASIMEQTYDTYMQNNIYYLVAAMICLVWIFILPWFFRAIIGQNYKILLMLIMHLPPKTVVDTPEIINFFSQKKTKSTEKMSISKSIVYDTNQCIIITNQHSIIEIVNQSVSNNIGLTPDQMLGQQIVNFVSEKDNVKLLQQIDLMNSGQGSSLWEDHIGLMNDKNEVVPFGVTMIGMTEGESKEIKSIVFILNNEIEEIAKAKAAEEAKAKSEKLLYQILPKDIVVRLNRGETDISFTIKSATIFFIDIVKFSNYAANLTPSEIMSNLSTVFATFDSIVSQYSTITKIKLIGDVYMAAAGLFEGEDNDPKKHANDSIRCCLECIKQLEDVNVKLGSSLEVRVGVNTGGPLIGGVLGTDKPTFDIIGDPINVAARLQSTDIPGRVQVTEQTKILIEENDFTIEERGVVYLKGKGDTKTYFVSHLQKDAMTSFSIALSTHE